MTDVPCEIEDMKRLVVQSVQALQVEDLGGSGSELMPVYARCLKSEDRPLACFGVMPVWRGVGQAWAILSDEILKDHPLALCRAARGWLSYVEKRDNLHRIQASVAVGHEAGDDWIRFLGFSYEGLMRNYGLGGRGDFRLYARVSR